MPPLAIGAAIGGIGSLVGGITGAGAAHDAANAQSQAAGQSLANINQQTNQGLKRNWQTWGDQQAHLAPYLQAGRQGLSGMESMAGKFQAPTGVTMQNDPGYQFRLQEGQKALERSASASGTLLGGAQAKALTRYGQDFGSNEYQNVYNRALQGYDTNFGSYGALAGIGQNAVGQYNQDAGQMANNAIRLRMANMDLSNQALTNRGAAQASGDVGANNAWQGAIGGLTNAGMTMGNLFRPGGGGGWSVPSYGGSGGYNNPMPFSGGPFSGSVPGMSSQAPQFSQSGPPSVMAGSGGAPGPGFNVGAWPNVTSSWQLMPGQL